jgi:hypothetical protein
MGWFSNGLSILIDFREITENKVRRMFNYTITVIYLLLYLGNQSVNSKIDGGVKTGIKFRCSTRFRFLNTDKGIFCAKTVNNYGFKKALFRKERFFKPIVMDFTFWVKN